MSNQSRSARSTGPNLTYVLCDPPIPPTPTHDLAGTPNSQILGYYKAEFDNDLTIAIPHIGVVGTIGAEPLNFDDPEQRSWLLETVMRRRSAGYLAA